MTEIKEIYDNIYNHLIKEGHIYLYSLLALPLSGIGILRYALYKKLRDMEENKLEQKLRRE